MPRPFLSDCGTCSALEANIHAEGGDLRQALAKAEESLRIAETHGLTALAGQIQPIVARIRSRASNQPQ